MCLRHCMMVIFVSGFALPTLALALGDDPSVNFPRNVIRTPATDLLDSRGNPVSVGEAASLAEKGSDLSLLDPADNRIWQNKSYTLYDNSPSFPATGEVLNFLEDDATVDQYVTYMGRVQSSKDPTKYYRMGLSRFSHNTLMAAALIRKLGYFIPSPHYYKSVTLQFSSLSQWTNFQTTVAQTIGVDLEDRKWILAQDEKKLTITMIDVLLEEANASYYDFHWGIVPDASSSVVTQLSKYRAFRGLILPLVLINIPESVNRYSAKAGSNILDSVVLNHFSARAFSAADYSDARWILRRMAKLSASEWEEIVKVGQFPKYLDVLILRKILYRMHNLLELFDLQDQMNFKLPDLRYNSPDGVVQDGKLMQERFEGYPQRFTHGDRENPFNDADLARYLAIDGISSVIQEFLKRINEKLIVKSMTDYYTKYQNDLLAQLQDQIKKHPFEPIYRKKGYIGGPTGGVSLQASRHITTGTYYESTAPIQLVDNVSVAANLGMFRMIDGMAFTPVAGGNLSYVRDYVHVKPIASVKAGMKQSWAKLLISPLMKNLGAILDRDPLDKSLEKGANGKLKPHPVDEFLQELDPGEVFIVSDSIAANAYLQVSSPLNVIFGFAPISIPNSISMGVDGSRVVLRQTSFVRTKDGVQVYTRVLNTAKASFSLDVNYFLNLLSFKASRAGTNVATNAYVVKYNPALAADADPTSEGRKKIDSMRVKLQMSLSALFKSGDTELLQSKLKNYKFQIEHQLNTDAYQLKFLTERMAGFSESHWMKLLYPPNEDHPELKPEDHPVILYSYKKGELVGRDIFGFFFDVVEALLKKPGLFARSEDPNPSNVPFGKAYWRIVQTDTDLTKSGKIYPSVNITQHVWGGWHLNYNAFMEIIDTINEKFGKLANESHRLIEKEAFASTKYLDFFRINAGISIHEDGLMNLREIFFDPTDRKIDGIPRSDDVKNPLDLLANLFSWFSEIGGARIPSDEHFYNRMIKIIGHGNQSLGERRYLDACKEYRGKSGFGDNAPQTSEWFMGSNYECLMPWMKEMLKLRRAWPEDHKQGQAVWFTEMVYSLENNIPLPLLMRQVGKENFLFKVAINGFRGQDENGDLAFYSNSVGDPAKDFEIYNGLFALYANKTGLTPAELDRSQGAFR